MYMLSRNKLEHAPEHSPVKSVKSNRCLSVQREESLSSHSVDLAWDNALIRSTSQTVFDNLTKIQNSPSDFRNRWLWELFQNTVDSSDGKSVSIEISLNRDSFVFAHNGLPFTIDEAVQLILKGSTKRMQTGKLGRFGTGFITTHVLSRVVIVDGLLQGGDTFSFKMDRICSSAQELEEKMTASKEQFKNSVKPLKGKSPDFSTRFTFVLEDENSSNLATVSVENMQRVLPYVLALNTEIEEVSVSINGKALSWRREDTEKLSEELGIVRIGVKDNGGQLKPVYIAVVTGSKVFLARQIEINGNKKSIIRINNIPKLFIAFPLYGTEIFPVSAIINSREFEPTEDRNGIWLREASTEETQRNRGLIAEALEAFLKLVSFASEESWQSLQEFARISQMPSIEWVDGSWLASYLRDKVVSTLSVLPLVHVVNGDLVKPIDALIPYAEDEESRKKTWAISSRLFPASVPREEEQEEWSVVLDEWSDVLESEVDKLQQCFTVKKLAKKIEGMGSVANFKAALKIEKDEEAVLTLNDFLQLVFNKDRDLLDTLKLLPDQNGDFHIRKDLLRDTGIDETLKNLSKKLGNDVRAKFVLPEVTGGIQDLLSPRTEEDAISEILTLINQQKNSISEPYKEANSGMLAWLIKRSRFDLLEGYPVLTLKSEATEKVDINELSSAGPLLAPPKQWDEKFKEYSVFFPAGSILSSIYESTVDTTGWQSLGKNGLVLLNPVVKTTVDLDKEKLDLLLAEGELEYTVEHRIRAEVSSLAYLQEEAGVMDLVRDSQERATKFLEFLLNILIHHDGSWNNPVDGQCECQKIHKFYPSLWLYAVRRRLWVPVSSKNRRLADAESLAKLFEMREDLQGKLMEEETSRFMNRLKVPITDIMKYIGAKDEQTRLNLEKALATIFLATGKSAKELNSLAAIWNDAKYRTEIEELVKKRELVHRNQAVGELVEQMVKEAFASIGMELHKKHRGRDFEYEYENDYVGPEGQVILQVGKYLFEVKSTLVDYVKMTPAQAEEAVNHGSNYILCVVRLTGGDINRDLIIKEARFVPNIGSRLEDSLEASKQVESIEQNATSIGGDIELSIQGTVIRFQINEHVWSHGVDINKIKQKYGANKG